MIEPCLFVDGREPLNYIGAQLANQKNWILVDTCSDLQSPISSFSKEKQPKMFAKILKKVINNDANLSNQLRITGEILSCDDI